MGNSRTLKIVIGCLLLVIALETAMLAGVWRSLIKKPAKPAGAQGRIAIVLDDWGYSLNNLPLLAQVHAPVTLSILPNLAYSGRIAQEARDRGLEAILHLPMEPHEKENLEKNTIVTSMSAPEITAVLAGDIAALGGVRGVSNHMGSKATQDPRVMGIIFKELKKRGMYFLDSFVTPRSVCMGLANHLRLDFTRRDVFIDNQSDVSYIRAQLFKLKSRAKTHGWAVGIGHDRNHTLTVLAELIPQFEQEGFTFVSVSDLARRGAN